MLQVNFFSLQNILLSHFFKTIINYIMSYSSSHKVLSFHLYDAAMILQYLYYATEYEIIHKNQR